MSYRTPDPLAAAQARIRELENTLRARDAELASRPVRPTAPVIYRTPHAPGDGSQLAGVALMLLGMAGLTWMAGGASVAIVLAVLAGAVLTGAAARRWG